MKGIMTEEKIRYWMQLGIKIAKDYPLDFSRTAIPVEFRQFANDLPESWTADYQDINGCLMCHYHRYLEHPVFALGGIYWVEWNNGSPIDHPLAFWEYAMTKARALDHLFTKSSVLLAIKIYDELYPPINGIPHDIAPVQPIEPVKEGVTACS